MKAYIGFVKDSNKRNVSVMSITDDKGVVLYNDKKVIERDTVRFETDLVSLKRGIFNLKRLMQNGDIPVEFVTLFINNKTVYGWLEKRNAPIDFMPILGDILLELSFMECESEVILSSLVDNKLKLAYKRILKEDKGAKVSDLFMDK